MIYDKRMKLAIYMVIGLPAFLVYVSKNILTHTHTVYSMCTYTDVQGMHLKN